MFSISNGWLSNTISQSRIINIARAAQQSIETRGEDHSCEMAPFEKVVDYVFCGSVKQEYMNYLYAMARNRRLWEKEVRKSEQARSTVQMDMFIQHVNENKAEIQRLMSGSSLEFATRPIDNMALSENYLIYKEKSSDQLIGLPLELYALEPQLSPECHLGLPIPNFPEPLSIRFKDYAAIKRSRQFIYQGQTYYVRFTAKNEPVVMQSGVAHQDARIQKMFTNFWAIDVLKSQLTSIRNLPRENATMRLKPNHFERDCQKMGDSGLVASAILNWVQFSNTAQILIDRMVNAKQKSLDRRGSQLVAELDCYEKLADPSLLDRKAFIVTQEAVISLGESQEQVMLKIREVRRRLALLFNAIGLAHEPGVLKSIYARMLDLTGTATLYLAHLQDGMDFERHCRKQFQFVTELGKGER